MNKIFKVIWNHTTQTWVAVSELGKAKTKSKSKTDKRVSLGLVALGAVGLAGNVLAATVDGTQTGTTAGNNLIIGGDAEQPGTQVQGGIDRSRSNTVIGVGAKAFEAFVYHDGERKRLPFGWSVVVGANASSKGVQAVAIGANVNSGYSPSAVVIGQGATGDTRKQKTLGVTDDGSEKIQGYSGAGHVKYGNPYNEMSSTGPGTAVSIDGKRMTSSVVAVGNKAHALGGGVAVGDGARAYIRSLDGTINADGQAGRGLGVAIGALALSHAGGVAVGPAVEATGLNSLAFGRQAVAKGEAATAVGSTSAAVGNGSFAMGQSATALGRRSIAFGSSESFEKYDEANRTFAESEKSIALGANAVVKETTATNSIAMGTNSSVTGAESAISIGHNANITNSANTAIAIGANNTVSGENTNVLGSENNNITGTNSTVLGNRNTVSGDKTMVLGNDITAATSGSVVLGDSATTEGSHAIVTVTEATVNGITYKGFVGAPKDEGRFVSVGGKGDERKIINVAAGNISGTSTEAINGSQLYLTQVALGNVANTTANHLGGGSTVSPDGNLTAPTYNLYTGSDTPATAGNSNTAIDGAPANNVGDALTALNTYINKGFNIKNNDDVLKGVVTPGETVRFVNGNGTASNVTTEADGVTKVTFDVVTTELKVSDGTADTAADGSDEVGDNGKVVVPQGDEAGKLVTAENIANAINNSGFTLKTDKVEGGEKDDTSTDPELINPGEVVEMVAGKNLKVKQEANGKVTYSTKDEVEFTSVQFGADGPKIQKGDNNEIKVGDKDGNPVAISNIAGNLDGAKKDTVAPTDSAVGPTADEVDAMKNNAATVGDVLNAGWNLKENGEAKDFVKPYDTVDFVESDTATVTVENKEGGKLNEIKVEVKTIDELEVAKEGQPEAGKVTVPANEDDKKKLVNAEDIANAINNSGFTLKTDKVEGGEKDDTSTDPELINSGEVVEMVAGKNLKVKQEANGKVTYSTKDEVEFTSVQFGEDGPKITAEGNNIKVGDKTGNAPVKITNVAPAAETYVDGNKNGLTNLEVAGPTNAFTVADAKNMGWIVDASIDGVSNYNKQVKNAQEVVFNGVKGVEVKGEDKEGKYVLNIGLSDAGKLKAEEDKNNTGGAAPATTGKVEVAENGAGFVSAQNVADVINASGFKVKATATAEGKRDEDGSADKKGELINPSDELEMVAGKNMSVRHDAEGRITYSTLDKVNFDSVQFGADGPKIQKGDDGSIKVGDKLDKPVAITNVKSELPTYPADYNSEGLIDLDNINDPNKPLANHVATVGDLANMGWVVSAPENGYEAQVRNANTVEFVGSGMASVGGVTTPEGVRSIIVHVASGEITPEENGSVLGEKPAGYDEAKKALDDAKKELDIANEGTDEQAKQDAQLKVAKAKQDLEAIDKVATVENVVNAINKSGWTVTSDKDGGTVSGTQSKELINPGETVTFKAGKNIDLKQEGNNFTYSLAKDINVNSVTVETTGPNGTGSPITMVSSPNNTLSLVAPQKDENGNVTGVAPVTVNGIKGNLDPTYNAGDFKDEDGKLLNEKADKPTPSQVGPDADKVAGMYNNAATVGDVLNAGWNLKENGGERDFVKPYDTVEFINGKGTKVTVKTADDGKSSTIKVDVETANISLESPSNEGKVIAAPKDLVEKLAEAEKAAADAKKELADAEKALADNQDPNKQDELAKALEDAKAKDEASEKAVNDAKDAIAKDTSGDGFATAKNVADAINESGWKATSAADGGTVSGTTEELINPGETVTFKAGKNIDLKQEGNNFTYSLAKDINVNSVTVETTGPNGTGSPITMVSSPNNTLSLVAPQKDENGNVTSVAPVTVNGIKGNLAPTYNADDFKDEDGKLLNEKADKPTPSQVGPDADKVAGMYNNAATVGDVLNAGWNLQGNGEAVDFVKPYDTVNFVDGLGTTVVAEASEDGKTSTIKVNTATQYTDANGNPVKKVGDKYYPADSVVDKDGNIYPAGTVLTDGSAPDGTAPQNPVSNPQISLVNTDGTSTTPTALGNVGSVLNITNVATNPGVDAPDWKDDNKLVDLGTNGTTPLADNVLDSAATVRDLANMGWVVSTSKDGDETYSDTVKNANKVDFVGKDGISVTGRTTENGIREITIALEKGEVIKSNEFVVTKDGSDTPINVIKVGNQYFNKDDVDPTTGKPKDGKAPVEIAADDKVENKGSGFVTGNQVADAIDASGWTVGKATAAELAEVANKFSKDEGNVEKVNPDDNVRFADGKGTIVSLGTVKNVDAKGEIETTTTIKVDVDLPIDFKYVDANGKEYVKANDGKFYPADKVNPNGSLKENAGNPLPADKVAELSKQAQLTNGINENGKPNKAYESKDPVANAVEKFKQENPDATPDQIAAAKEKAIQENPETKDTPVAGEGGVALNNVAWATNPDQAVNKDQLDQTVNKSGFFVKQNGKSTLDNVATEDAKTEKVTPNDVVDFVDGKGTSITATTAREDGRDVTKVKVDIDTGTLDNNADGTVKGAFADKAAKEAAEKARDNAKVAKEAAEKARDTAKANFEKAVKELADATTPEAQLAKAQELAVATTTLNHANTAFNNADKALAEASKPFNKVATVENVADAINKSGFTLKTSATAEGQKVSGNDELINPGKTVEMVAGKNMTVKQEANGKITYATKDKVEFTEVTVKDADGNTVVTNGKGITINNGAAGNPVSLTQNGLNNGGNKITNVAKGTSDTDAVNVKQLKDAVSGINKGIGAVNNRVNKLDKRMRGIGANVAASASLPQVYIPGKSMFSAAAGGYNGASAVAVGYSRASDNGKVILKLTGTANSAGQYSGGVGIGYQW